MVFYSSNEMPEFNHKTLQVFRQPLEEGSVTISRALRSTTFPAEFILVAAMNPCPCSYRSDPRRACSYTPAQVEKYLSKISGPLLDRIDLHVEVPAVAFTQLAEMPPGPTSADIREGLPRNGTALKTEVRPSFQAIGTRDSKGETAQKHTINRPDRVPQIRGRLPAVHRARPLSDWRCAGPSGSIRWVSPLQFGRRHSSRYNVSSGPRANTPCSPPSPPSGPRRTSSPDLAAPLGVPPIHPVVPDAPHLPMIEVGHPEQTSSFSPESLVLVLSILLEIFLFRMRFLVSRGSCSASQSKSGGSAARAD